MAKKIPKTRAPMPLSLLFVELLTPWIVMGLVAVLAAGAGLSAEIIFIVSIASALVTTILIRYFEKNRRKMQALRRG